MRMINHRFPWCDRTEWAWTDDDVKLLQVIDDVNDVDAIINRHVAGRRTCVQAGAACGIWPYHLTQIFENVLTVEPVPENYECAAWNLTERSNLRLINGAFGSGAEGNYVFMKQHPHERNNAGSQQVDLKEGPVKIPVFKIDELVAKEETVDFIALDLEGYELPALEGAVDTINRCRPVIMVEDKGLSTKFGVRQGEVVQWLLGMGYYVAQTIKRDVVMVSGDDVDMAS